MREPLPFSIKNNVIVGESPAVDKYYNKSINVGLFDSLSASPTFIGQIDHETGREITFAEMKDQTVRCALWLKKQGIKMGDIVAFVPDLIHFDYIPMVAALYLGAIFNPWVYNWSNDDNMMVHFLRALNPKVMFVADELVDVYMQAAKDANVRTKFIVYGHHQNVPTLQMIMDEQSREDVDKFRPVEISNPEKQPGAIMFSSGSTNIPKMILLAYTSFVQQPYSIKTLSEKLNPCLWFTKLCWASSAGQALEGIIFGRTRIVYRYVDADTTSAIIQKYKVNIMISYPLLLNELIKNQVFSRYDFSSLHTIRTCGMRAGNRIVKQVESELKNTKIQNLYGLTEVGCVSMTNLRCKRTDSIGHVLPGVQLKVVDLCTGKALGPNETGEIVLKSKYIMLGYYQVPELMANAFDNEGWFHTGDIGNYDENGELVFIDRKQDRIVYRGGPAYPQYLENLLMTHPDVFKAAVVGFFVGVTDESMAFVQTLPDRQVTEEELYRIIDSTYEGFKFTRGIEFVDFIPHTESGKFHKQALKKMAKAAILKNK